MSQNFIDKVSKAVYPIGTILTFWNGADSNDYCMGTWSKRGDYCDVIAYDSFQIYDEKISGSGIVEKTGLRGIYYEKINAWFNVWLNNTPSSYYPVMRLGVMGYTAGNNTIHVFLNNKETILTSWGPNTYRTRRIGEDWFPYSALGSEAHPINLPDSALPGLNLYYSVTGDTSSAWEIDYITLELGYKPYDTKREWMRMS